MQAPSLLLRMWPHSKTLASSSSFHNPLYTLALGYTDFASDAGKDHNSTEIRKGKLIFHRKFCTCNERKTRGDRRLLGDPHESEKQRRRNRTGNIWKNLRIRADARGEDLGQKKSKRKAAMVQIIIDGSILEGGGQILRNCTAYATILKTPIVFVNIRGNRPKPGLQRQHLTGLNLVKDICDAETENVRKDSQNVTFAPGEIKSGTFSADVQSAGSCALLVQVSLPILLFAPEKSIMCLRGGTNVSMSPPIDYLSHVLLPMLKRFGADDIHIEAVKRGFVPKGGGEILVHVSPVKQPLTPITLMQKGKVEKITCYLYGYARKDYVEDLKKVTRNDLEERMKNQISTCFDEGGMTFLERNNGCMGLMLVAETSTGCLLAGSALAGKKTTPERLAQNAVNDCIRQLETEACVDEHMQDQLIVFMAFAEGVSEILSGSLTLHTKTAIHFAEKMTGAKFDITECDGHCNVIRCTGIGYMPKFS